MPVLYVIIVASITFLYVDYKNRLGRTQIE